ncbi:MAG: 2-amino-4-hydroxy-6-hydroxymethyldihydropteridine diphosphokinase [Methylophaga sp.]|nr:2-amino-4-hydroxy-6-hydroxymethyldihydropteridine diphosphokinase [Methylophaga sp.]
MRVFIGLGSNLDDPAAQVQSALQALNDLPDSQLIQSSSLYKSPPMGPQDQPDYINAVAEIETALSADELLQQLQELEQAHGRIRRRHWGERTLDLDILLYGQLQTADATLTIPHPGIALRPFVLYPLAELAPNLSVPGLGNVAELCLHCPTDGLEKMEKTQ